MRITGNPQMFDVDPFVTPTTTQQMSLGARGYDALGRELKYAKVGAVALVVGNLLQSPARDVQFTDLAVQAAAVAAQNQVAVTNGTTTIASGDFANGTAAVTVTPGLGQNFVIKAHTTGASGATITLTLYENIQTALSTVSKITISPNPYNGVIASPTTRTGKTVGVALVAAGIGTYTWIGTKGRFGVLSDATIAAVGEGLSPSTSTAGCVTKAVTLLERIGTACLLGISAKCEQADLDIT